MKIGIDFDGVIANCGKLKRLGAQMLFNVDIPEEEFKKEIVIAKGLLTLEQYQTLQKEIYENENIGMHAEMVPEAMLYINKMLRDGHTLCIITSRNNESLELAKCWSNKYNILLPFFGTEYGTSKATTAKAQGIKIFIDDDMDKLIELKDTVPHLFLFSWGYNISEDCEPTATRVSSWEDFYLKIQNLT